jgi:hypothetical protein
MKRLLPVLVFYCIISQAASAQDTVHVQAMTFGSAQDTFVVFPPDTFPVEKIIMNYKLRCPYNVQCGEWDYLTYTHLYKPTGVWDSVSHVAPSFVVNGASPDSFQFMYNPSYSYNSHFEQYVTYNSVISYDSAVVGGNFTTIINPFYTGLNVSRTQYLWKASELLAAGVQPGAITNLKFDVTSLGDVMKDLAVRMKHSTLDSLTSAVYENTGFQTVYRRNTQFTAIGLNAIDLTYPFTWDGVSNLVIDFSFNNPSPFLINTVSGDTSGFKSGITLNQNDRTRFFEGNDFITLPPAALASVDSFITICFWSKGNPAYMPQNSTAFEAYDSLNHRVLNIHLPWGDSKIYWDAGNNGGTSVDRLSKTATAAEYEGNWTYWTFVKNVATGRLKIYKNGAVYIQATGQNKRMYGISKIRIGSNLDNNNFYDGHMDDFAIFNTEVSQANIQQYMYKHIDATHPDYARLLLYYTFDESQDVNTTVYDNSANVNDGTVFGIPQSEVYPGADVFKNFYEINERPQVVFGQGVYNSTVDSILVIDSVETTPVSVVVYGDSLNPTLATDTVLAWNTYYNNYLYDAQGNATDSTAVSADTTLYLVNTTYYDPPFEVNERYELARYITPYGNGLSLGNGFLWRFDVSDYEPLLHDTVHLNAGNWQELLDLSFDIIKGTPPRDVQDVKNIWTGDIGWTSTVENELDERQILIPLSAQNSRLKVRLTGHGADQANCAEFCPNFCYLFIDSVQRYSRQIWRTDCPINPLYPQGGTWVYPRANWCPGAEVTTYDMELTPYVTPGDSTRLNLNLNPHNWTGGGWPNYVTETQLITYGAPNFQLDAAIYEIKAPNDKQVYQRMNPICNNPLVTIQNTGADTLTSLLITYGLVGGTPSYYNWTGNLPFMATQDVRLGNFLFDSGNLTFYATVSAPNGSADPYANNNTAHTTFPLPPEYNNQLIFELKTNLEPYQNVYDIKDDQGNLIFHKGGGLTNNTVYNDTITFPTGCYEFKLTDSGEDGLTWWANPNGGSGYMRIKRASDGVIIKSFNSDFGGQIYHQFTVGYLLNTSVPEPVNEVNIFPNPAAGIFNAEILLDKKDRVAIEVIDMTGRVVYKASFENVVNRMIEIDLSAHPDGIYSAHFTSSGKEWVKKFVLAR